jgi:hypothetical protein
MNAISRACLLASMLVLALTTPALAGVTSKTHDHQETCNTQDGFIRCLTSDADIWSVQTGSGVNNYRVEGGFVATRADASTGQLLDRFAYVIHEHYVYRDTADGPRYLVMTVLTAEETTSAGVTECYRQHAVMTHDTYRLYDASVTPGPCN